VRAAPHSVVVFEDGREPGGFYEEHLQTADALVDCCPAGFAAGIERLAADFASSRVLDGTLRLIGRRDSRMHNSWYANVESFKRGARARNAIEVHPADAQRLGVADGDEVVVRSDWGQVETIVRVDDAVRPGVVAMEHGWGRQPGMRLANDKPGVNINRLLPSGPGSFDPLSNQAWMTGIPVTIERSGR
jgi:formate dehydrogenase